MVLSVARCGEERRRYVADREPDGHGSGGGASHAGTVTLTIPTATLLNTYFVLACADATNAVVETDEINNCKASSTTVTITP
jgi:hypothetical protein